MLLRTATTMKMICANISQSRSVHSMATYSGRWRSDVLDDAGPD